MDSDEKKLSGGAGGGDDDHADFRDVDGLFGCDADQVKIFTHDQESSNGLIGLAARGGSGKLGLVGFKQVNIASDPAPENFGGIAKGQYPSDFTGKGVLIWACGDDDKILIQRGTTGPNVQWVELSPDGLQVYGGLNGFVSLAAGSSSFITITPTSITIKSALVKIN